MSLGTAIQTSEEQEKLRLVTGLCPHYNECKEYDNNSYYCLSNRLGVVIREKIVCYSLKDDGNGKNGNL